MITYINAYNAVTPCFISTDFFINFTSLSAINYPHYEIVDISQPMQWRHNYLFVGRKSEQYTLNFTALLPDPVTAHAWRINVAQSTGSIGSLYDYWGNESPNQIFKQVRYTDNKVTMHNTSTTFCNGSGILISGDMTFIPS